MGGHYGALAVAKALAHEGLRVTVLTSDPHDHICNSRFVSELIIVPHPSMDSGGLLTILMEKKRDWDGALLIPSLDEYVIFVSQNAAKLKERFLFTIQAWEVVKRIINKNFLYAEAQHAAIPTPRFFLVDSVASLEQRQSEMLYPCILKPYESRVFSEIYGRKVLVAYNFQELVAKFIDTQRNKLNVMISEIIPGDDSSIFSYRSYIDSQGEILAEMCTQKLRQYPPGFGQGSVVRTVPIIPTIRDHALTLLRNVSYRGESSAEFRLDSRDNQYKLMEINVRPVVTEWLFVKVGMNFPYITYLDLVEDIRNTSQNYELELYWIHNHWEVVNFINYLMTGNLELRKFLQPYWKKKVFAVPLFDDPIHFFIEMYRYSKAFFKKMRYRSFW